MDQGKSCILCGRCLEVCPLFAATGREELSPRGKAQLLEALGGAGAPEGNGLERLPAERLAALCLGCGRCEKACPQSLCVPDRLKALKDSHPGWRRWLWKQWIGRSATLWPLAGRFADELAGPASFLSPGAGRLLEGLRPGPAIAPWLRMKCTQAAGPAGLGGSLMAGRKAVLFAGCVAKTARRDWADKAEGLMRGLGLEVLSGRDFACCGCTYGHSGLTGEQDAARRRNVEVWRDLGRPLLVTICATCHCGLKAYARESLLLGAQEAGPFAEAAKPLAALLARAELAVVGSEPGTVIYHRPCHGGAGGKDAELLERAVGERLLAPIFKDGCCGFGGLTRLAAPELTDRTASRLWDRYAEAAEARGASLGDGVQVVSGCSACVLQLASTAPGGVVVGHWLDLIQPAESVEDSWSANVAACR